MKIVTVFGSPRQKGNSATLAEAFLFEAEQRGAKVSRHHLGAKKTFGCICCEACKREHTSCVLKDDLSPVLHDTFNADTVVIATPLYFLDMPAQCKAYIDRWYSFFNPEFYSRPDPSRLSPGKNVVFVVSQGAQEGQFHDFIERYAMIFSMFGFKKPWLIRGGDLGGPDAAAKRPELLERARFVAQMVMDGEPSDSDIKPYD